MIALDTEIAETETMIEDRIRRHKYGEIILRMPGFGPRLGPDFLAAIGANITLFDSDDRLAGIAGLAPVPATPAEPTAICIDRAGSIAASSARATCPPN